MKSRRELDLDLVKSAQAGDSRAFEALMKRYKTRLVRYLTPLLRDVNDSEDVVQETFIKVFMALNSFRGESSFATWLFRIGINTAKRSLVRDRHILRASAPSGDAEGSQQYSESATDYTTPEASMETKQVLDQLDAALSELPTDQRTCLILRELEGLSYEEIAEQMHTPVGTVRSRIHRARMTIAAALKAP